MCPCMYNQTLCIEVELYPERVSVVRVEVASERTLFASASDGDADGAGNV